MRKHVLVKKDGLYLKQYGVDNIKFNSYIPLLAYPVKFDDDVTFEDFFNYIMEKPEKYSEVFESSLGGLSLSLWSDEWEKKSVDIENMTHLLIRWDDEEKYIYVSGFDNEQNQYWGIDFIPINKLKLCKMKLDDGSTSKNVKLFDIIDAILDEISFYGDPDGRNNKKNELYDKCINN